jgi:hypothetical protein
MMATASAVFALIQASASNQISTLTPFFANSPLLRACVYALTACLCRFVQATP